MYRMNPTYTKLPKPQHGITMIESLVAIVVMTLGILGILGVQMRNLSDTSTTVRRAQAIRLIEDLGERMRINPNALANLGNYVSTFATTPSTTSCASGCDNGALAAYDVAAWKKAVRDTLPLGQAEVFIPPAETALGAGQRRQLGIMIAWRENEGQGRKTDDIDATKIRDNSGALTAGAGALTCPANFTCHLQYIPVSARCAPYAPGGNSAAYFCPGG
jgi:type IV pilus assembly protein PilV